MKKQKTREVVINHPNGDKTTIEIVRASSQIAKETKISAAKKQKSPPLS